MTPPFSEGVPCLAVPDPALPDPALPYLARVHGVRVVDGQHLYFTPTCLFCKPLKNILRFLSISPFQNSACKKSLYHYINRAS